MDIIIRETCIVDNDGKRLIVQQDSDGRMNIRTYGGETVQLDDAELAALRIAIGSSTFGKPVLL